jgi:hypothetical protein
MSSFDLIIDESLCPKERNALKVFFDSAKGGEWTTSDFWVDEYTSHCEWYGIECNEANNSIRLDLQSNGLSGILTPRIGDLRSLEILNLNNNNIKASGVSSLCYPLISECMVPQLLSCVFISS